MTPLEMANEALNSTLEAVQPLMKRCMKLKESDPTALIFSDEIARRVAKDLKLYGGAATSFSPQLLSCAAVVRQHSKAGAFVSLPNWNSMVDNDPCIRTHPWFHKTVGYCPPPRTYPNEEPELSMSSSTVLVEPHSTRGTLIDIIPACTPEQLMASKAPDLIQSLHVVPEAQPSISELPSPAAPHCNPHAHTGTTAPMFRFNHSRDSQMKLWQGNTPTGGPQKRKLETDDSDPEPNLVSRKPVQKQKRTFTSDEEGKGTTDTIHVKQRALSVKACNAVAWTNTPPFEYVDERGFWDAESRPAGWGLDATVATAAEVGRQSNLITYCLTYSSILFAIIPGNATNASKWMTYAPKSRTAVKTHVVSAPPKTAKLSGHLSSLALQKVMFENPPIEVQQEPQGVMPDDPNMQASCNIQSFRSLQLPPVDMPAHVIPSVATYYSDLSPYNTRERTCIISRMIRASGPWAHDKNILDYDGWAGRQIIPDGDGWAHAGNI
ncbi:uncharacterized protein HD556DRAFT_1482927 [Suillus plorans]|uniref:Uncharacterized protein n=1 Tax=Suillus plorans TaxID=116603 RepID=A0A9P7ALP5_9AGAM|nr:uncharacterized protein HD556DRAFT_1482927 [Suillus plorans]KAG1792089.1 hypothetical protein HD556DRAFT_1482927 [Suillus plorans]